MAGSATLPLAVIVALLALTAYQGGIAAMPGPGFSVLLVTAVLGIPGLASALLVDRWSRSGPALPQADAEAPYVQPEGALELETVARQLAAIKAERAQVEATLLNLNDEITARLDELSSLQTATRDRSAHAKRLEALGTLASGVAHDFGNVLQVIEGGVDEILEAPSDAASVQHSAILMQDVITTARDAVRRLLAFARQEASACGDCDVSLELHRVREMLLRALPKNVALYLDLPEGLPLVQADGSQLKAALLNVAANAQHAMPQGGVLRIVACTEEVAQGGNGRKGLRGGQYVRIDVTDNGVGMSAATLARASEAFFTTRPAGEGTGLGLSATRGFAEQCGGAFALASAPGRGTTVSLWLPGKPRSEPPLAAPAAPERAPRIILLDDEAMSRDVMSRQLGKHGLLVEVYKTAAQALAVMEGPEPVDLLLTEYAMPDIACSDLIARVHDRRPDLPVVILTGFPEDAAAVVEHYAGSGLVSLLCKPAAGGDVAAEIRRMTQRQSEPVRAQLEVA